MEADVLQNHFPSQNTDWAEKTLVGDVITTKKPTLLLTYFFRDLTAYFKQSLRLCNNSSGS